MAWFCKSIVVYSGVALGDASGRDFGWIIYYVGERQSIYCSYHSY